MEQDSLWKRIRILSTKDTVSIQENSPRMILMNSNSNSGNAHTAKQGGALLMSMSMSLVMDSSTRCCEHLYTALRAKQTALPSWSSSRRNGAPKALLLVLVVVLTALGGISRTSTAVQAVGPLPLWSVARQLSFWPPRGGGDVGGGGGGGGPTPTVLSDSNNRPALLSDSSNRSSRGAAQWSSHQDRKSKVTLASTKTKRAASSATTRPTIPTESTTATTTAEKTETSTEQDWWRDPLAILQEEEDNEQRNESPDLEGQGKQQQQQQQRQQPAAREYYLETSIDPFAEMELALQEQPKQAETSESNGNNNLQVEANEVPMTTLLDDPFLVADDEQQEGEDLAVLLPSPSLGSNVASEQAEEIFIVTTTDARTDSEADAKALDSESVATEIENQFQDEQELVDDEPDEEFMEEEPYLISSLAEPTSSVAFPAMAAATTTPTTIRSTGKPFLRPLGEGAVSSLSSVSFLITSILPKLRAFWAQSPALTLVAALAVGNAVAYFVPKKQAPPQQHPSMTDDLRNRPIEDDDQDELDLDQALDREGQEPVEAPVAERLQSKNPDTPNDLVSNHAKVGLFERLTSWASNRGQPMGDKNMPPARQLMEQLEGLTRRYQDAESDKAAMEGEYEKSSWKLQESQAELATLKQTVRYLQMQLRDQEEMLEKVVIAERRKAQEELGRMKEAMVRVVEREREAMRDEFMKQAAELQTLWQAQQDRQQVLQQQQQHLQEQQQSSPRRRQQDTQQDETMTLRMTMQPDQELEFLDDEDQQDDLENDSDFDQERNEEDMASSWVRRGGGDEDNEEEDKATAVPASTPESAPEQTSESTAKNEEEMTAQEQCENTVELVTHADLEIESSSESLQAEPDSEEPL